MAYPALDIANKILHKATESDHEDLICNLKLQKILYYMQGFHLAYFNSPLFEEDIESWHYGPVVPEVYEIYKDYGKQGIEYTGEVINLEPDEEALFDEVYDVYGSYSSAGLTKLTQSESPCSDTPVGVKNIIPKDILKDFFKHRLK